MSAEISWMVNYVFDPDESGQDFAYTVGLAAHGLPELHLWAQPSEGDDPGEGWTLSPHDCTVILNGLGRDALTGTFSLGDERQERYDGGLTTMRLRAGEVRDAHDELVCAYACAPGTPVLMCTYEIQRPAPGVDHGLHAGYAQVWADALVEWELPPDTSAGPEQAYGPWTRVIEKVLTHAGEMDGCGMIEVLRLGIPSAQGLVAGPSHDLAAQSAIARAAGRTRAHEAALARSQEVIAELFLSRHDEIAGAWGEEDTRPARHGVEIATAAAVGAWVLRDVIAEAQFLAATGVLEVALRPWASAARGWEKVRGHVEMLARGGEGALAALARRRWLAEGAGEEDGEYLTYAGLARTLAARRGMGGFALHAVALTPEIDAALSDVIDEPGCADALEAMEDLLCVHAVEGELSSLLEPAQMRVLLDVIEG